MPDKDRVMIARLTQAPRPSPRLRRRVTRRLAALAAVSRMFGGSRRDAGAGSRADGRKRGFLES
jgi:hypothetical protein